MQSNPLVARLTRGARWPSVRVALWFALGLGAVSLGLSTWTVLHAYSTQGHAFLIFALLVAWLMLLVTPLVVAVVAARLAARDARSQEYDGDPGPDSPRPDHAGSKE